MRIIQQSAETEEPHEFVNYGNGIVNLNGPTIGVREFREINLDKQKGLLRLRQYSVTIEILSIFWLFRFL